MRRVRAAVILIVMALGGWLVVPVGTQDIQHVGQKFADGTSSVPAIAFAAQPTFGFYRSASLTATLTGTLNLDNSLNSASGINITSKWKGSSPADGIGVWTNNAATIGIELKADALPVASACGAGSPAVVAGSTPFAGSVTVGTGGPITCTITWGGTAFPQAPFCSGAVATTTAANARAMGYLGATTTLTIVPATAWVDGSVVTWVCPSSK